MDDVDNSYLLFVSDGLFFLLPVCCLDRVMDAEKPEEEAEAAECNILAGALGGNGKRRYRILLHKEASEEKLLLPADDIIDLREINDEQILELTEPVLNERNRYLIAVAVTETQEGRRIPAYILDPACLSGVHNGTGREKDALYREGAGRSYPDEAGNMACPGCFGGNSGNCGI